MRLISGSLVIFEGTVCMCDTDLCNTDVFETSGAVTGSVTDVFETSGAVTDSVTKVCETSGAMIGSVFQMVAPVMFGLMVASFSAY